MTTRVCVTLTLVLTLAAPHGALAQMSGPSIQHLAFLVPAADSGWRSTTVDVDEGDLIVVRASGFITIGRFSRDVDARGVRAAGSSAQGTVYLEMRVGRGTPTFVGTNSVHTATAAGRLEFRVFDTRYDDNAGTFRVDVIIVPSDHIPDATTLREGTPRRATPLSTPPSRVEMAPASDVSEYLTHFLKTLATHEEVYFVDHLRYSRMVQDLSLPMPTGIVVERLTVSARGTGWAAVVRHQDMPNLRCGTAIAMSNPLDPSATDMQIVCR